MLKLDIVKDRYLAEKLSIVCTENDDYNIKEIDRILESETVDPELTLNKINTTVYTSNKYIREALNILKNNNYEPRLLLVFEKSILPKINNNAFNNLFDNTMTEMISESSKELADIIQENRKAINIVKNCNKLGLTIPDERMKSTANIWNICKEVSEYSNVTPTGRLIISIESCLVSSNIDPKEIVDNVMEFYACTEDNIVYSMANKYFCDPKNLSLNGEDDCELPKNNPYAVQYKCNQITDMEDAKAFIIDIFSDNTTLPKKFATFMDCLLIGYTKGVFGGDILAQIFEFLKSKYDDWTTIIDSRKGSLRDNISLNILKAQKICDDSIYLYRSMDSEYLHNFIKLKEYLQDFNNHVNDSANYMYEIENEIAVAIMDESFTDIINNITTAVSNAFVGVTGIFDRFKSRTIDRINLRKFKNYKAKNLITMTLGVDKQIRDRMTNYRKNGLKGIFGKMKKFIFKEDMEITNEVLAEMVNSSGIINISVGLYEMNNPIDKEDIKYFSETMDKVNNTLETGMVYFICSKNTVEFIYRDFTTEVELTSEEAYMIESYFPEYDRRTVSYIASYSVLDHLDESSIIEALSNATGEEFKTILELFSIMGVDKETVMEIYSGIEERMGKDSVRAFREECNMDTLFYESNPIINNTGDGIIGDDLLEACTLLNAYIEEKKIEKNQHNDNHQEKDDKTDKHTDNGKDEEKPKKKLTAPKVNLNDIKLYIAGLKDKAKNLSAKEKALSRAADTTFNMFMKNLQQAMVSDRREAIIKGSVIPSFSKSIKIALGLAGLGLATGGPAVPLIAALGAFACSKSLTKRERALLLDDIVIEMHVLDKEISVAENNNNYKKMRELMKTKRELERQYARIQFNSRVGKDIIPSRNADY